MGALTEGVVGKTSECDLNLILDHIQECPAIFKSQQIDEPDLTKNDKRRIAECILISNPLNFLIRFGTFLKEEHLSYFLNKYDTSYEVKQYVKTLMSNDSTKNSVKRNRRFEAMRRMQDVGDYFSEEQMEKREPLLYFQMVGQYLTEKEKLEKNRKVTKSKIPTFSNFLLDTIEKEELSALFALQKEEEERHLLNESSCSDIYFIDKCRNEKEVEKKWGTDWEEEKANKSPKLTLNIKENYIPNSQEKALLFEEFKSIMQTKFLCGHDTEFNYFEVDSNSDFDCLDIKSRDEEEKYFDEETSDLINSCTDTGRIVKCKDSPQFFNYHRIHTGDNNLTKFKINVKYISLATLEQDNMAARLLCKSGAKEFNPCNYAFARCWRELFDKAGGDTFGFVALTAVESSRTMATAVNKKCVTMDNMNENIIKLEYAVRGPIVIRAGEIEKELQQGMKKPFTEVLKANIGDCHAMGQQPITFFRQVLALVALPSLLDDPSFPEDAKQRARAVLKGCKGGSVGSYTDSVGIEIIRKHVAEFIGRRDGIPSNYENIVLSAGASDGIKNVLKIMNQAISNKKPGIMVPIPQYPLYSATLAEFNMHQIGYYLDESKGWGLDVNELQRSIDEAKKVSAPRAIVVINPGNPTGQVLSKHNIEEIIKFAHKERLFILADEVYQDNIYAAGSKFYSFKKVLTEMGPPYSEMELASFMSCSKGYMGECGLRGAYFEVINICPQVKAQLFKAISAMLCPTTLGQTVVECIVNPPKEGDPSYPQYKKEREEVLAELKKRAKMVADTFNSISGMSCNEVQGAMYAFPQMKLPPKAIEAAKKEGKAPDTFYALQLLENTGICIVPGSGFGQKPGTFHFRTTILPQTEKLMAMLETFRSFHETFVKEYS